MATWIFAEPFAAIALGAAIIAAALIVYYLIKRPKLDTAAKLLLLCALGVFPVITAGSGNYAGFEQTTKREFCNGCHVMEPWIDDAEDPTSTSLSSIHARNDLFGERSCYTCHADYGMFGTVNTKMGGLRHVYHYLREYHDWPVAKAVEEIRIRRPFPNKTCTHCHSTELPGWQQVPDHRAMRDPEEVGCASKGCHGPAHPFSGAAR